MSKNIDSIVDSTLKDLIPEKTLKLIEEIAELKKAGYSNRVIAEKLGVRRHVVAYIVSCFDLTSSERKKLNRDICVQIVKKYREGLSVSKIASIYGVSSETVRGVVKALKVKRSEKKWGRVDRSLLIKFYQEGLSDREIAEKFNVSKSYIKMLRWKFGLRRYDGIARGALREPSSLKVLISLLEERKVIDSLDFLRVSGRRLEIVLINRAIKIGVPLGYVKILATSGPKLRIFPQDMCERFIVYLKGYEKEALKRLLLIANPMTPMIAIKNRVTGPLAEYIPEQGTVKTWLKRIYSEQY